MPYKTIASDTLALVKKGDMVGAQDRGTDLGAAWDKAEDTMSQAIQPDGGLAPAAGAAVPQQDREACEPDVFRLCSADIPDETRIVACLNARSNDLSPVCRRVIDPAPRLRSKGSPATR